VTRECLAAIPDTSISGARVARELTALIGRRGKPGMIVSDNGTEFTSNTILTWSAAHRIDWHYIAPGKPMQNAYVESFNGRVHSQWQHRDLVALLLCEHLNSSETDKPLFERRDRTRRDT
jgi:transposase InsO family protein